MENKNNRNYFGSELLDKNCWILPQIAKIEVL
jgi:hypothetical protein